MLRTPDLASSPARTVSTAFSPVFSTVRSSFTSTPGTDPVREMFMAPGALLVMVTCPDSPGFKATDSLSAFTCL
jgi:hypothetical protein